MKAGLRITSSSDPYFSFARPRCSTPTPRTDHSAVRQPREPTTSNTPAACLPFARSSGRRGGGRATARSEGSPQSTRRFNEGDRGPQRPLSLLNYGDSSPTALHCGCKGARPRAFGSVSGVWRLPRRSSCGGRPKRFRSADVPPSTPKANYLPVRPRINLNMPE